MGDSLDHRSHRNHGSMIVFSETWLLSTMSNYQSVNLKKYIYNYPSSFHLGGGVGATHFVVALRPPILYGKICHFCGSAHPEVFPPASGEIPELFLVISTGTSPTVKEKPIAIFDCQVMGIHNWDILWYVMDLNSRIIPCSDNYWRLMGIWIDTIHLERERESETPKKLPTFFFRLDI